LPSALTVVLPTFRDKMAAGTPASLSISRQGKRGKGKDKKSDLFSV
jgi:hypothetical protein